MKKFRKVLAVFTFLTLLSVTSISKGNVTVPPITKAPGGVVIMNELPPIDNY